jgi:hypothetical protein
VLPAPKERFDREWVELYNPGERAVELSEWRIDDAVDGGAVPIGEVSLLPGELLVVELGRSMLNNGGDTVRLLGPDGGLVDSMQFEKSQVDRSLALDLARGTWLVDAEPSPGLTLLAVAVREPEVSEEPPALAAPGAEALTPTPLPRPAVPSLTPIAPDRASVVGVAPGAARPAATYAAGVGVRYTLATTTARAEHPPAQLAPQAAPSPGGQRPSPGVAGVGVLLIVIACALLVAERTPAQPGRGGGGML